MNVKKREKNDRIRTNFIYTVFGGNSAILRRTTQIRMGMMLFYIKFYLYYFRENFFLSLSSCFCFSFFFFFVIFLFPQMLARQWQNSQAAKQPGTFSVCACAFLVFLCAFFCFFLYSQHLGSETLFEFNQYQSCS